MLSIALADANGLEWSQKQVEAYHYLHTPVDTRCSPVAYILELFGERVGCLIFGRPEATRVNGWYGSVQDVLRGKCRLTRWEILNLARVWLHPDIQQNGKWYRPDILPGFYDRKGIWHSRAASYIVELALNRVVYDFLMLRPPVWLDEPYEIKEILSYCDTRIHKGTLYRASHFQLIRKNEYGIETYSRPVRELLQTEKTMIARSSQINERCRKLRGIRNTAIYKQLSWVI